MFSWNRFLDKTIVFSFDKTGYKRHLLQFPQETYQSQQGKKALITGGNSGLGFSIAKGLASAGINLHLVCRNQEKGLEAVKILQQDYPNITIDLSMVDLSELAQVDKFCDSLSGPFDYIIHNAGAMPAEKEVSSEGYEKIFASQVFAPFIINFRLAKLNKLSPHARIIFISSGGMYLQKLNLSDLNFTKTAYNHYKAYANAKRAQIILTKLFATYLPQYTFSSMHPGWANTPGVQTYMPLFFRILKHRLRTSEEGADTAIWLALTATDYPSGKFWFDRTETSPHLLKSTETSVEEEQQLWDLCQKVLDTTITGEENARSKNRIQ